MPVVSCPDKFWRLIGPTEARCVSGCRDYIGHMAIAKALLRLTSCREKMIDKYIRTNSERRGEPFLGYTQPLA